MLKRFFLILLLTALCLCAAFSARGEWDEAWTNATTLWRLGRDSLKIIADCPVYSAPFDSAWQPEGDAAALRAGQTVTCLGNMQNGKWIWVEYDLPDGGKRIGWIMTQTDPDQMDPDRINSIGAINRTLLTLEEDAALTDDPRNSRRTAARLRRGDTVIGITQLRDEDDQIRWVLVEAQVDGRPAWGFLPSDTKFAEIPLYHLEGETLYINEGVTILGQGMIGFEYIPDGNADPNEWASRSSYAELRPGDLSISLDPFLYQSQNLFDFNRLVLPASLRCICIESISSIALDELRLEGTLKQVSTEAFYASSIGNLILASDYTADLPEGEYATIGAYTVEEGNPRYCSMDGVLFTADKKTLLRYPTGKTDEHYDVPRGTEHISEWSFSCDDSLPLKTISLPIGLKTIGDYAFSGCQRLISLTVPLTVTEIGEHAFYTCISLERLSLPPGLSAGEKSTWVAFPDMTYYNGDNGETSEQPKKEDEEHYIGKDAYIDTETGYGDVPVYTESDAPRPCGTMPAGTRIWINAGVDGRAYFYKSDYRHPYWISLDNLSFFVDDSQLLPDRIRLAPGAVRLKDGTPADLTWLDLENPEMDFAAGYCLIRTVFDLPEEQEALLPMEDVPEKYSSFVRVPFSQVTLLRSDETGRRSAYLVNPDGTAPIPLYGAPGGEQIAHAWSGMPVELGEFREGWVCVKTPIWERWVEEIYIWEIIAE